MSTEPKAPTIPDVPIAPPQAIEQYKAKLTDIGNLGSRQSSMTTCYVSIVSALLGLLAFKERSLFEIDTTIDRARLHRCSRIGASGPS